MCIRDRLIDMLQLTTGVGITYSEQLSLLEKYGDVVNPEPSRTVADKERQSQVLFAGESASEKKNKRDRTYYKGHDEKPKVIFHYGSDQEVASTYGPRKADINRISYTTALDTLMMEAIASVVNVDGYASPVMPTLWHWKQQMSEEFALYSPRNTLEFIKVCDNPCPAGKDGMRVVVDNPTC